MAPKRTAADKRRGRGSREIRDYDAEYDFSTKALPQTLAYFYADCERFVGLSTVPNSDGTLLGGVSALANVAARPRNHPCAARAARAGAATWIVVLC